MRIGVIGSGIGGLLAGVSLIKKGHDVTMFEKLSRFGGRFTNFEHMGFQLSTGALHMMPHGKNGPLGNMLKSLGIDVDIVHPKPEGYFRINGKDYLFRQLPELFSLKDQVKLASALTVIKFGSGGDETYREWLRNRIDNELAMQITDSFCGWTISINSDEISAGELIAITKNINKLRGPGVPMGGCMGISGALVREFENNGGAIHYKTPVNGIKIQDGRATGIKTKDNFEFDVVVSDIGPKETLKICDTKNFEQDYVKEISEIKEACGIKMSIACKRPMLGHPGIVFTPQARRIDGINEVTNADPSLAPEGMHLMMTHQRLDPSNDTKSETGLGLKDLHTIFPDFDKYCEVLLVQTFKNQWPVNRARSGKFVPPLLPVKGLYFVGDAVKPKGWMETEGVAAGVKIVVEEMEKL
ncbi:MAG: NAD(P)/FAD-dependent oxidoreductase [Candidatus Hydrothermarchaeaceae archaeon]